MYDITKSHANVVTTNHFVCEDPYVAVRHNHGDEEDKWLHSTLYRLAKRSFFSKLNEDKRRRDNQLRRYNKGTQKQHMKRCNIKPSQKDILALLRSEWRMIVKRQV